jgi:hypothetical protein
MKNNKAHNVRFLFLIVVASYALRYGTDHRVRSELLSAVDRSGSSNEVLRDVLGLPSSSPTWVEDNLQQLQEQLSDQEQLCLKSRELHLDRSQYHLR